MKRGGGGGGGKRLGVVLQELEVCVSRGRQNQLHRDGNSKSNTLVLQQFTLRSLSRSRSSTASLVESFINQKFYDNGSHC